jgi:hypothetical protein
MISLFRDDKRDEALERLAIGITEAAKNCTMAVKKINAICQCPENYSNPGDWINAWIGCLFVNYYQFTEEWISPVIISVEDEEGLANSFFNYFVSLTPFYFEYRKVISLDIIRPKKYGWTAEDYKELKLKLFYKWFYSEWDSMGGDSKLKIGMSLHWETQRVLRSLAASSRANSALWNKQKKIDDIVFSDNLMSSIRRIKPPYKHQYQSDLFLKYTSDFVEYVPLAFQRFEADFYHVGDYLHRFFKWSSTP